MGTGARVTAYVTSLACAAAIGYYARQPEVQTIEQKIDYKNIAQVEELWQNMPQDFKDVKIMEGLDSLPKTKLYWMAAEHAWRQFKDHKIDVKEFSKENAQGIYDIIKDYVEERE